MLKQLLLLVPFLAIYSAAHWFMIRRFMLAGFNGPKTLAALGIWSLLMVFGPAFVVNVDSIPSAGLKSAIAFVVYTWLAFLFVFLVWSHLLRFARAVIDRLLRGTRDPSWRILTLRSEFFLHLGLSIGLILFGFRENANPRLERIEIPDSRIPAGTRFRIAFVCDLHLGIMDNTPRMQRTVDLLESIRPDLLLAGGDMTDVQMHDMASMSAMLSRVPIPAGRLAVTGNHEWYAGFDEAMAFHRDAGFRMLNGEAVDVTPFLTVAGFPDPFVQDHHGTEKNPVSIGTDAAVLSGIDPGRFTIVLRHRPGIATGTNGLFDLQLSGHTHGGQIWPMVWMTVLRFGYLPGMTPLGNRSRLYISRGSGTIGPQVRIFAPPEVTVIDLVPADQPAK